MGGRRCSLCSHERYWNGGKTVSRLLARTESVEEAGPAEDRSGVAASDQANVASESDLGLAPVESLCRTHDRQYPAGVT